MKSLAAILVFVISSLCWGTELPDAPAVQAAPERDPVAWSVTGFAPPMVIGAFTKPAIGFWAGVAIDVAANTRNRTNMAGALAGSGAGYVLIKTLKHDWHHKKRIQD